MKKLLTTTAILATFSANSALVEFDTNFGVMTEFDKPQQMDDYPNFIDSDSTRNTTNSECISVESCDEDLRYFGFKYALTDTFKWFDGGYIFDAQNGVYEDFYINILVGGEKFSHKVENTDDRWTFGHFYHSAPTSSPVTGALFSLTSVNSQGDGIETGYFVFDDNRTKFYASDKPLLMVPETGTFALFLLGAVGLCVRRQMKQQA